MGRTVIRQDGARCVSTVRRHCVLEIKSFSPHVPPAGRLVGPARLATAPPVFLLAGALAGACASGLTTPFDVLKTRVGDAL